MLLAATKTPIADQELIDALRFAWTQQLGGEAKNASLAVLCAQVALETAHGKSCICWNIGNSKAYPGSDVCRFTTTEYINGKPVQMTCAFAAYSSLAAGVAYYLRSMWTHWTKAWPSVVDGDPKGFAQGLKDQDYYTAPVDQYVKGVVTWFDYYSSKLGGDDGVTEPEQPAIAWALPDEPTLPDGA